MFINWFAAIFSLVKTPFILTLLVDNFLVWSNIVGRGGTLEKYCIEAFDVTKRQVVLDQCFRGDPINSIVSDGKDIYASHGQSISRFSLDNDGTFREIPSIQLEDQINDMVLTRNTLFVGTKKQVLAIDRQNPKDISSIVEVDREIKFLSFSGGALYVVGQRGTIYKFSPA